MTDQSTELTKEQEKIAQERIEKNLCPTCGYSTWFCGGVQAHLKEKNK